MDRKMIVKHHIEPNPRWFKHTFAFIFDRGLAIPEMRTTANEIVMWCNESNFKDLHYSHDVEYSLDYGAWLFKVVIKDDSDAMRFKLVWFGK
jgi:hypothetical protein